MQISDPYIADAAVLVRASRRHRDATDAGSLAPAVYLAATGIEHVLKAILYEVNPLYIFKDPSFEHSVSALYESRVLQQARNSPAISKKPNHDVIAYRESLRRAAVFSAVVQHNTATLYRLSDIRDTVAHCRLDGLEHDKLLQLCFFDLPRLVMSFEAELGLPRDSLDGADEDARKEEQRERSAAEQRLRERVAYHQDRWVRVKDDDTYVKQAKHAHDVVSGGVGGGHFDADFDCPACGNPAVVTAEVDYDYDHEDGVPVGAYPVRLECTYCGLIIEEPHELDGAGVGDFIYAIARPQS